MVKYDRRTPDIQMLTEKAQDGALWSHRLLRKSLHFRFALHFEPLIFYVSSCRISCKMLHFYCAIKIHKMFSQLSTHSSLSQLPQLSCKAKTQMFQEHLHYFQNLPAVQGIFRTVPQKRKSGLGGRPLVSCSPLKTTNTIAELRPKHGNIHSYRFQKLKA